MFDTGDSHLPSQNLAAYRHLGQNGGNQDPAADEIEGAGEHGMLIMTGRFI